MPNGLATSRAMKMSTKIAEVENEDLACWSTCAKPVLVNKLPLKMM
jgi:hypothetical protein